MTSHRFTVRALAWAAMIVLGQGWVVRRACAQSAAADPRGALVVSTSWLAAHLKDPDLVLLHVGDPAEYEKEHIPGARLASLRAVSVSSPDHEHGLMLEMPAPDSLRALLQALGVSDRSRVVVYYGNDWVSPATRVVFTLDYAGLGARTSLLDGGMQAWKRDGHAVTAERTTLAAGRLSPLHVRPIVVDAAWVNAHRAAPGVRIVDGRAAVFYDGVEAGGSRKGHVAGAGSFPFTEVTDDSLRLRSPAALAALFEKAGVGARDTVVAYCHIGQQATAVLFAARTLGHPVLLYDGSFQEWGRRTDLPVDNPADGGKGR
jgi:thiosulfate/3-mercaptopyruvate sulfurtransferase